MYLSASHGVGTHSTLTISENRSASHRPLCSDASSCCSSSDCARRVSPSLHPQVAKQPLLAPSPPPHLGLKVRHVALLLDNELEDVLPRDEPPVARVDFFKQLAVGLRGLVEGSRVEAVISCKRVDELFGGGLVRRKGEGRLVLPIGAQLASW